ncbi:MAG: anaerobic ribonucleoside-triphosphate reductase activating protein, partial [Oscillospiraceae bacterium]|nr:anaerobic ribonucleoside-triphosphate reductase activating protein [Oscillospiraceae bacterium]
GAVPYEFRTTVVAEHHNIQDIEEIAKRISGAEKYFLQKFVDSGHLIGENLHELDENTMKNMLEVVKKYVKTAELRGI